MPENENLLHQIRFILYDAGTPLSAYEIAYRLLSARLQTSDSVELLRQQVCLVAVHSPLYLLFHRGLIKPADWPESLKQTVVAVHKAYYNALAPDHEDLPEWYQPVLLSLLCYKYLSDVDEMCIEGQCRFEFVLLHNRPPQWPMQLAEALQTINLSDLKVQAVFKYASQVMESINAATLYHIVQQVQDASLLMAEPFAFVPVVRKLFSEQLRQVRILLKNHSQTEQ